METDQPIRVSIKSKPLTFIIFLTSSKYDKRIFSFRIMKVICSELGDFISQDSVATCFGFNLNC